MPPQCRRPRAALELARVDGQPCQPLREVVVQFARQAAALVFVRGEQPAAQPKRLLFGTPAARALDKERSDQAACSSTIDAPAESGSGAAPRARRPEAHLGARRQPGLRNSPARELAPVEASAAARAIGTSTLSPVRFDPVSMRAASFAVTAPMLRESTSGPPTMPLPSWSVKMPRPARSTTPGWRGARVRPRAVRRPCRRRTCNRTRRSSAAARPRAGASASRLRLPAGSTRRRSPRGASSRSIALPQNCSSGEPPTTSASVSVPGCSSRMVVPTAGKSSVTVTA